jgi:hypothetical protein
MARGLLEAHRAKLMAIATRLNESQVMSGDEVRLLMGIGGDETGDGNGDARV